MGLYPIDCPECGKAHMWFSGNLDQRCHECKTTYTPKCPICKEKLVEKGSLHEDGSQECPGGHYWYQHSYGNHEILLDAYGDKHVTLSLGYSYSESPEAQKQRSIAENAFIQYAKVLLKEKK